MLSFRIIANPALAATSPAPGRDSATGPYFHATTAGDRVQTTGLLSCRLGHRLERPGGGKPDGVFAAWSWDGSRLTVENDRYGFYPLYYFVRPGEICISPSIPALLARGAPRDFDEAALAVFLRLGFFIGEATAFRAIRALPPDARFEWTPSGLDVSGRIALRRPQPLSRDQALDGYIALFRQAIQRRLPPPEGFALPLSGGRDSRHILLELVRAGHRPRFCVTMRPLPPRPDADVKAASALAGALGVEHVVLDQPPSRVRAELRKNLMTGFCTDEHAWCLPMADFLKGRVGTLYDGIGGDVLSGGFFVDAERAALAESGRLRELAERLFQTGESRLDRLLAPEAHRRLGRDLAVGQVAAELARHASAPNPVESFYFWNRTRREIALVPYGILADVGRVLSPYLDHDLFDLLASLPWSLVVDRRLHTDTILRAHPSCEEIPFEDPSAPPSAPSGYVRRFARDLAGYTLARPTSRLVRKSFLLPRLARCLLNGDYRSLEWTSPVLALYLLQLEGVAAAGGA